MHHHPFTPPAPPPPPQTLPLVDPYLSSRYAGSTDKYHSHTTTPTGLVRMMLLLVHTMT